MQDIMGEFITSAYPFYSQGLAAKFAAPGQLANLATQQVTTPMALATTVGALPRGIEQDTLNSIFEAMRKTQEFPYQTQAPIAGQIMGQQRYMYDPGTVSPSIFSQMAPLIGMLGAAAIMGPPGAGTGGPAGMYGGQSAQFNPSGVGLRY